MSEDVEQSAEQQLMIKQLVSLKEIREYKLKRIERDYVNSNNAYEQEKKLLEQSVIDLDSMKKHKAEQVQSMTDAYLSCALQVSDIMSWRNAEKNLGERVIQSESQVSSKQNDVKEAQCTMKLKKDCYQKAMLKVEKIDILKDSLINGEAN